MFPGKKAAMSLGGILSGSTGPSVSGSGALAGAAQHGSKITGIAKGAGMLGKSALPMGASLGMSAAKGIGGMIPAGLGFGLGNIIASKVATSTYGIGVILISLILDFFVYMIGEKLGLMFGVLASIAVTWTLIRTNPNFQNGFFLNYLRFRVLGLLYLVFMATPLYSSFIQTLPQVDQIAQYTILNHALFIYFFYTVFTGVLSNREAGLVTKIIYWAFFLGLLYLGIYSAGDVIQERFEEYGLALPQSTDEQRSLVPNFLKAMFTSSQQGVKDTVKALSNAPDTTRNLLNAQVEQAGGAALFGSTKKDQPRLGIVLNSHPNPVSKGTETTDVRAIAEIENPLENRNFLAITNIRCWHEQSRTRGKIKGDSVGYSDDQIKSGIPVFYNRPLTITCRFDNKDLEDATAAKVAVEYDFEANAQMTSFLMQESDINSYLIDGTDPLDAIAIPPDQRKPVPMTDNAPAEIGMGPVELQNPPFGIKNGNAAQYPPFEVAIRNNPSLFNGEITRINEIIIAMPPGISLKAGTDCPFSPTGYENEYSTTPDTIQANQLKFTNIKTNRAFTCGMGVSEQDLLWRGSNRADSPSYVEAEFNVDVDFTYETQKSVKLEQTI